LGTETTQARLGAAHERNRNIVMTLPGERLSEDRARTGAVPRGVERLPWDASGGVTLQLGPSALGGFVRGADDCLMAWFFRAIEMAGGRWECHHGARVFDEHLTLTEALEHLRALAADQPEAAQLFVHTLDGQVRWEGAP
jgi:hypothetical protein